MKALDILNKILKEINDDSLFLSEDFIPNLEIKKAIEELEALEYEDKLAELEKTILDYYLSKGYKIGVGNWGFIVEIKSLHKQKYLKVSKKNGILVYQGYKDTTKDMFDKAIEHFKIERPINDGTKAFPEKSVKVC